MRKIIVAIALIIGVGMFAGCGSTDHKATPAKGADTESVFLSVVHKNYPDTENVSDSKIVALAHATCDAFDRGATFGDVLNTVVANSNSDEQAEEFGFIIGAGVQAFCPEYVDEVTGAGSGA